MNRFCDNIRIIRHGGDIYNPFDNSQSTDPITTSTVYDGACKAQKTTQNSMVEESYMHVYINKTGINADVRDEAYIKTNNTGNEVKMSIIDVKEYERNTILTLVRQKDGENE